MFTKCLKYRPQIEANIYAYVYVARILIDIFYDSMNFLFNAIY